VKRAELACEQELAERLFAWSQPLAIQDREPRWDMYGTDMEVDARQMTQWPILARQQTDTHIDAISPRMQRLVEDPVATLDPIFRDLGTNEIERAALPCTPTFRRCVLGMEPADAGSDAEGERRNLSPIRTSPA